MNRATSRRNQSSNEASEKKRRKEEEGKEGRLTREEVGVDTSHVEQDEDHAEDDQRRQVHKHHIHT